MEVQGTEFIVTLGDGRVMRSRDLAGTVLDVRFAGRPMRLRIAAVEPDPQDRSGTVWLHTLRDGGRRGRLAELLHVSARTAADRASRWPMVRTASN